MFVNKHSTYQKCTYPKNGKLMLCEILTIKRQGGGGGGSGGQFDPPVAFPKIFFLDRG